jgi:hypothetical protein
MRDRFWWRWVILTSLGIVIFGAVRLPLFDGGEVQQAATLAPPKRPAPAPVFIPEPPPAEPSSEVPTLVQVSNEQTELRIKALAHEMAEMWTRDPEELVVAIDDAARSTPSAPSVTLLLAIAHAETNGMILDVSGAGAVGLAQATPVAYHQEGLEGKLYVTSDYLLARLHHEEALGDADTIASMVVEKDNAKTRKKARRLLVAAKELRREGIDELDLLAPYASKRYYAKIKAMDEHNKTVLNRLGKLLQKGSRAQLRAFRNEVRTEYRSLKQTQIASWAKYQNELIDERDRMLEAHFGMDDNT